MCVFGGSHVRHVDVADTRIFARLTSKDTQILVYEMAFASVGDVAMILPLPVGSRDEETAVRFIDLSGRPEFFNQLRDLIPLYKSMLAGSLGAGSFAPAQPPLKVHKVGVFDASFVPTIADLDRLDPQFRLPDDVWAKLPQYADYGFAVFKLRETRKKLQHVHPMAFEFSTRLNDTLFIPTVHVHDGQLHPHASFDHIVYLQGKSCSVSVAGETCKSFIDGPLSEFKEGS